MRWREVRRQAPLIAAVAVAGGISAGLMAAYGEPRDVNLRAVITVAVAAAAGLITILVLRQRGKRAAS